MDEPPAKKSVTDYTLCLYCQEKNSEKLVDTQYRTFNESAYGHFMSSVQKKYEYGNPDFLSVYKRLVGVTEDELKQKKASWHRKCYSLTTHNLERDEQHCKRAIALHDSSILTKRKRGRPCSIQSVLLHKDIS